MIQYTYERTVRGDVPKQIGNKTLTPPEAFDEFAKEVITNHTKFEIAKLNATTVVMRREVFDGDRAFTATFTGEVAEMKQLYVAARFLLAVSRFTVPTVGAQSEALRVGFEHEQDNLGDLEVTIPEPHFVPMSTDLRAALLLSVVSCTLDDVRRAGRADFDEFLAGFGKLARKETTLKKAFAS